MLLKKCTNITTYSWLGWVVNRVDSLASDSSRYSLVLMDSCVDHSSFWYTSITYSSVGRTKSSGMENTMFNLPYM